MKKTKKPTTIEKPKKTEIETFRDIRGWFLDNLIQKEPSCFNSILSIKKYRVTVEEIEEPKEVLIERLQKLWDECQNHHHWSVLKTAAKELGITLIHKI